MKKLWSKLENILKEKYGLADPEWVQVDISRNLKIHVTIVTDQELTKESVRETIAEVLESEEGAYTLGFVNIYSVHTAEELMLSTTERDTQDPVYTWSDGLNAEKQQQRKPSEIEIISFYSYKGGVGRTISMIQTAYNLAKSGKRVLMMDLDIEAPSLHNLFAESVNQEQTGVAYGLIEYLYRAVVQKRDDMALTDIFCTLPVNDIEGAMFLIPALKKMDKQYLYQIGRLQAEQIQEKNIFTRIFDEIRQVLHIDYILVDTRAGFNPWGSLSLLSLSTQVIFVAYPNEENIEGLNMAFEMMDNVGKNRYAVAMSKMVASQDGLERAKDLVRKLNIRQNRLLPIYYREEIALNHTYPMVERNIAESYQALSDYILDNERIDENRRYLAEGRKAQLLENLFTAEKKRVLLTGLRRFIEQDAQTLLIYHHEAELYGLQDEIRERYFMISDGELVPERTYVLYRPQKFKNSMNGTDRDINIEEKAFRLLKTMLEASSLKDKISGLDSCNSSREIIQCLHENAVETYTLERTSDDVLGASVSHDPTIKVVVFVHVTEACLEADPLVAVQIMKQLILEYNKRTPELQYKFVIQHALWQKYQDAFTDLKGSTEELKVSERDVRKFIYENMGDDLTEFCRKKLRPTTNVKTGAIYNFDRNKGIITMNDVKKALELLLGIRTYTEIYSMPVEHYIYRFLVHHTEISYDRLLDALVQATAEERENPNEDADDRLISFGHLEKALKQLCESQQ